ncbi:hypothetical protein [Nocardioides montaniterrae]
MSAVADRAAVARVLKGAGAKARRGHLRLQVGELCWYVDSRVSGAGARQRLVLEVGCWTASLPPEPDGGAVDCPLLVDVDVTSDPVGATTGLVAELSGVGDLAALGGWLDSRADVLVDARLRALLPDDPGRG